MEREVIRRHAVVRGRVQGVSFRYAVSERADARNVAGWVRNCSDGSVEAVLEGRREDVGRVLDFLRTGPPLARVEDVEVRDEQPEGLRSFDIR